jgi:aspartate ammonia-lyase
LVEVHGILKTHAVNLEKIVSDLRLLSSDLIINREVSIPHLQVGSSIMPGKVNPVIAEFVISAVHKIYANDQLIGTLCGQGNLELNAYIPVIGHALIETIKLLIACDQTLDENMIRGLQLNSSQSMANIIKSPSITTALIPFIGYVKASELAARMRKDNIDLFEANKRMDVMNEEKIKQLVNPENLLKEGFDINDIG